LGLSQALVSLTFEVVAQLHTERLDGFVILMVCRVKSQFVDFIVGGQGS